MNKRQARIEALATIVGILQATDMGTFLCYLSTEESEKAWREFEDIRNSLMDRWQKMEANQKAA